MPPAEDLRRAVAELSSYRELFTDGGEAVHGAMEWARGVGGKELEKVVPYDTYTPLAKRVLEAGYVFRVEPASGKPSIQEVQPVKVSEATIALDRLIAWAGEIRWPDRKTVQGWQWGFTDGSDDTPRLCSFARIGAEGEEERVAWRAKVAKEVESGHVHIIKGTEANPFAVTTVPIVWRRTAVIPKPHRVGEFRLIVNRSLDQGESHAPNSFSEAEPYVEAEWLSKAKWGRRLPFCRPDRLGALPPQPSGMASRWMARIGSRSSLCGWANSGRALTHIWGEARSWITGCKWGR